VSAAGNSRQLLTSAARVSVNVQDDDPAHLAGDYANISLRPFRPPGPDIFFGGCLLLVGCPGNAGMFARVRAFYSILAGANAISHIVERNNRQAALPVVKRRSQHIACRWRVCYNSHKITSVSSLLPGHASRVFVFTGISRLPAPASDQLQLWG
jgi:hypothetical protein